MKKRLKKWQLWLLYCYWEVRSTLACQASVLLSYVFTWTITQSWAGVNPLIVLLSFLPATRRNYNKISCVLTLTLSCSVRIVCSEQTLDQCSRSHSVMKNINIETSNRLLKRFCLVKLKMKSTFFMLVNSLVHLISCCFVPFRQIYDKMQHVSIIFWIILIRNVEWNDTLQYCSHNYLQEKHAMRNTPNNLWNILPRSWYGDPWFHVSLRNCWTVFSAHWNIRKCCKTC